MSSSEKRRISLKVKRLLVAVLAAPLLLCLAYNIVVGAWFELSPQAARLNDSLGSRVTVQAAGGNMTVDGILCAADTVLADARIRFRISVVKPLEDVDGEPASHFYSVLLEPWEIGIVHLEE